MLLIVLYIIGITAETMTGALAAGHRQMDMFGVLFIALACRYLTISIQTINTAPRYSAWLIITE